MQEESKDSLYILIVDDEPVNIEAAMHSLEPFNYHISSAKNGEEAVWLLLDNQEPFDIVLLDRTMPGMDGIEVLKTIKKSSRLKHIPVIMQTARNDHSDVAECIREGAYYYLTKPYSGEMLTSIVSAAAWDVRQSRVDKKNQAIGRIKFGLMENCSLKIKTLEEAKDTALFIANLYPEPDTALFGIHELLINAIEHGNLNVGYDRKTMLLREGTWAEEVEHRLSFPENKEKYVEIEYSKTPDKIILVIKDHGNGFNWQEYMTISPDRVSDNHGRGIAISALMSFNEISYNEKGNNVSCIVHINREHEDVKSEKENTPFEERKKRHA